jgi:hypothetical protein
MVKYWDEFMNALGLDPNGSYGEMDPTKIPIVVKRDPDTGETWMGTHSRRYPGAFPERATETVDFTGGFESNGPVNLVDTSMVGGLEDPVKFDLIPPLPGRSGDDATNWWTPFLTGEAIVAGSLILGPMALDLIAAFAGAQKKSKKGSDPVKLAAGLNRAAASLRDSTAKAMPTIMAGLSTPAFSLPFVYINLEALHKQGLIDSAIAHTIEPVMIGAEMIKAVGQSGIVSQFLTSGLV